MTYLHCRHRKLCYITAPCRQKGIPLAVHAHEAATRELPGRVCFIDSSWPRNAESRHHGSKHGLPVSASAAEAAG